MTKTTVFSAGAGRFVTLQVWRRTQVAVAVAKAARLAILSRQNPEFDFGSGTDWASLTKSNQAKHAQSPGDRARSKMKTRGLRQPNFLHTFIFELGFAGAEADASPCL
jgi:hypothetical protein